MSDKPTRLSPFDFAKSINETKEHLMNEVPDCERDYSAFMVNRCLSYYPDTLMFASEMNQRVGAPVRSQYAYFFNAISKRKRFSKWAKADPEVAARIKTIQKTFGVSQRHAMDYDKLLPPSVVTEMQAQLDGAAGGPQSTKARTKKSN